MLSQKRTTSFHNIAQVDDQGQYINTTSLSPIIIFGSGLLIGSLIGTSGIVIISLLAAAYYFRDTITTFLNPHINIDKF